MALRTAAPPRSAALAACLSLACWHGPTPTPLLPVAVLPLDAYGGAIYVPAVINGDSAWLMLDTGLSRTGLDRDWARTAGIDPMPAPEGGAPAGPVAPAASTAVVDTIRLGALTLLKHRVALYSLHGLSEASGRLQVGLVGHDVLEHYTVEIDYRERRVRLFDAARYRYKGAGTTVRFTPDADLPLLRAQVKVRGRRAIPARLLLDTGASGLCLILTTPFAEQHGLGRVAPAIEAPIGTGLVGELHGTIVRLQQLRLGGVKVPSPTTGLGGEYKGFLARTDIDGVIGNSVFDGSRLIVDYVGRRAVVEPRPGDNSPCDFDMSGLRLAARGPGLAHIMVDYVVPRSPSAEAGIAVGDELLLIDGRGVAEGDLSDARKALRVEGTVRRLVLRRDADTIRVALKLRKLL
ncbi:MAG TPA: aspartyl protease family protein [Gemmatimonadales bacterium]|nr:aspartyl protease family protein [Gemmatimonadales bacterium]